MADLIVVGSGLFGLTIAERAASTLGLTVLVLEKRSHLGGNAHSEIDKSTGIEVHKYGSHLFHTSNEKVWAYINQFSSFNNYQHKVWASHHGEIFEFPINLNTINKFFGKTFDSNEAEEFIKSQSNLNLANNAENLEDRAIGLIGKELYEAFIKNYTAKQWQTDPKTLPADVINRLPMRFTPEHRYFNDKYEGLPTKGYSAMMESMIDNSKIEIRLGIDFFDLKSKICLNAPVVFTGPIDRYFDFVYGPLSWRTLDFDFEVLHTGDFQNAAVVNFPDLDQRFTRIHEFRHLHPERDYQNETTVIAREYSRFASEKDEPYYPVNTEFDRLKLNQYRELAKLEKNVWFGGRLGSYRYLDMHMAIASALTLFENKISPNFKAK